MRSARALRSFKTVYAHPGPFGARPERAPGHPVVPGLGTSPRPCGSSPVPTGSRPSVHILFTWESSAGRERWPHRDGRQVRAVEVTSPNPRATATGWPGSTGMNARTRGHGTPTTVRVRQRSAETARRPSSSRHESACSDGAYEPEHRHRRDRAAGPGSVSWGGLMRGGVSAVARVARAWLTFLRRTIHPL
jgi:hypothetical protein